MARDGLGLTRAPTAVSIAITLCPYILDSCFPLEFVLKDESKPTFLGY